ncbi:MobF family relaxase [Streptomyces bacillaris]|uniref:MobF family relaxase n=1 Tax=Streptomyces bacillaris TaxID=68179 RepID=UPI003650F001
MAYRLAAGDSPKKAYRAGALGRRVTVTGVDFVFRPQPTIYLLWAFGDEETRRVIEAAHERAIERVLEWIEDDVAVIRYGKDGIYRVRPPGGLVAARFRHYEARSGRPLLHDHLLLSVKGQRLDGKWGSIHTTALHENTVAASALYNELVAAEVCEELGLATEPRTVTLGRRPVMEIAGVPHGLIRWTSWRSDQIATCLLELEHEYVTAVDGEPRFLPVVSERARAKLNQIAARKTRPPKQSARPLAQLRAWWKASAILTSGVAADVITSLLGYARAAAAAIRARVAAVVDVALAAVDVAATVFVMNEGGRFHRRHLLAEARRHLALVLCGRRRDPGLDEEIVAAAISTHCLDITEPKTVRGLEAGYRLYTARWSLSDLPARRRPPGPAPDPDRQPPADPGEPAAPRPPERDAGEWEIPRVPLQYERAVLARAVVREKLRTTTAVRGRAYDVVAHQQAAMPEQLLAPEPADPEHDDQEPKAGRGEAIDLTALRALRKSRTDVEALDLTADRLRRLQEVVTTMADDARARADRVLADRTAAQADADAVRPDDQQAHRPQQPGPHRGREAGH